MDLLRHWRRRTFGAAASALIAPTAIVGAALAVGVGGGGLGGLQSIGQAFNGPDLPAVTIPTRGAADDAGRLLARVGRDRDRDRPRPRARAGVGAAAAAPDGNTQVAAAPTAPSGGSPQTGGSGGSPPGSTIRPGGSSRPNASQPPAATPTAPPPAPTPQPSLVRQVGDGVKTVTDQVPIAGQPAGQVVDLLVDTVDGLSPREAALLAPEQP